MKMANFRFGDGKRLGKALPQHKLMQSLLINDDSRPKNRKIHTATQTESKTPTCGCGQTRRNIASVDSDGGFVHTQIKKLDEEIPSKYSQNYHKLLTSIRERVCRNHDAECCCSCSGDSWSDNSDRDVDTPVRFPRETRNAMSVLLFAEQSPLKPKSNQSKERKTRGFSSKLTVNRGVWPGAAQRIERTERFRPDPPKIMPKLSRNKLN